MTTVKISSKIEEQIWEEFKQLAQESQQNTSTLLSEVIANYTRQHRTQPTVMKHLFDSIEENEELGKLLAQ